MALYHPIEKADLERLCAAAGLRLVSARGVAAGSINTNYALQCSDGRYFLRYTHVRSQVELEFEAALLAHLRAGNFPCPTPIPTVEGQPFQPFREGFVSIFPFQLGEELARDQVDADHAFRAGETMGRMHQIARSFARTRPNPYGEPVVSGWLAELTDVSDAEVRQALPILQRALARSREAEALPLGAIHADYFRDNVKWIGDRISAVFDFEMACTAPWMLDVGIGLCEWTWDGRFQTDRLRSYMDGYRAAAEPGPEHFKGLFEMTLFAGVRFTISRIRDFHLPGHAPETLAPKDFRRYLRRTEELLELGEERFQERCGLRR